MDNLEVFFKEAYSKISKNPKHWEKTNKQNSDMPTPTPPPHTQFSTNSDFAVHP